MCSPPWPSTAGNEREPKIILIKDPRFRVQRSGLKVWGLGFGVQGLGLRTVYGSGSVEPPYIPPRFVRASCFEKRPTGDSTKLWALFLCCPSLRYNTVDGGILAPP